jgi:hypothetical protein
MQLSLAMTKESHAWRVKLNVAKQREGELFLRILRDREVRELHGEACITVWGGPQGEPANFVD